VKALTLRPDVGYNRVGVDAAPFENRRPDRANVFI
jgi:hypothetical protein